eukprot:558371-Prymnesium_polylepis.1
MTTKVGVPSDCAIEKRRLDAGAADTPNGNWYCFPHARVGHGQVVASPKVSAASAVAKLAAQHGCPVVIVPKEVATHCPPLVTVVD